MDRTKWARTGDGIVKESDAVIGEDGLYTAPTRFEVKSGCYFCGSNQPTRQKPSKVPDSSKLPATGWKRNRR